MHRTRWIAALALGAAASAGVAAAAPAEAVGLAPVTGFGSNPGDLAMYEYVPAAPAANPAVVVAMHGCTQTAADYLANSGWPKYADRYGFVLVFPEQKVANNSNRCLNWFEPVDTTRGQGEALSIKQMVDRTLTAHGADPGRVFVTGLSAGGAMTSVLLATYPDGDTAAARRDLPPGQQLRPRPGRPRHHPVGLRVRRGLRSGDGPVQHVRPAHPARGPGRLLHRRRRGLPLSRRRPRGTRPLAAPPVRVGPATRRPA